MTRSSSGWPNGDTPRTLIVWRHVLETDALLHGTPAGVDGFVAHCLACSLQSLAIARSSPKLRRRHALDGIDGRSAASKNVDEIVRSVRSNGQ
jgi:hypothetical protein